MRYARKIQSHDHVFRPGRKTKVLKFRPSLKSGHSAFRSSPDPTDRFTPLKSWTCRFWLPNNTPKVRESKAKDNLFFLNLNGQNLIQDTSSCLELSKVSWNCPSGLGHTVPALEIAKYDLKAYPKTCFTMAIPELMEQLKARSDQIYKTRDQIW